jgi:regulator of replication initiation timing
MDAAADPALDLRAFRITGPREGRRRGGFSFGPEAVVLAASMLDQPALAAILGDPQLKVETSFDGAEFALAISEIEPPVNTADDARFQELAELVDRLNATLDGKDQALASLGDSLSAVERERDDLKGQLQQATSANVELAAELERLRSQVKELEAKPAPDAPAKPKGGRGQAADEAK